MRLWVRWEEFPLPLNPPPPGLFFNLLCCFFPYPPPYNQSHTQLLVLFRTHISLPITHFPPHSLPSPSPSSHPLLYPTPSNQPPPTHSTNPLSKTEMKLTLATLYSNFESRIVSSEDEDDMVQTDAFIAGPVGGRCVLGFRRVET